LGVEGDTDDPRINKIRKQQVKNFFAILMLSHGTPMLLMGDEMYRTQKGNNNAYCIDDETTWVDWSLKEEHLDLFEFVTKMISFRKTHPALKRECFFQKYDRFGNVITDITWHGVDPFEPDTGYTSHSIAFMISGFEPIRGTTIDNDIYVILNQWKEPLQFILPPIHAKSWYRVVDTSLPYPDDFLDVPEKVENHYNAQPHSTVIFISK